MTASSPRRPPPRNRSLPHAGLLGLLAALFCLFSLGARAQPVLPAWDAAGQQAWWTAHPTPDTWPAAADALQAQLEAAYGRNGATAFSDVDFQGWMEHLEWVRLGLACPDLLAAPDDVAAFIALGKDESVSHLLIRKLVPRDNPKAALQNLVHLARANMADLHDYAALGVAYCVVFDGPFPAYWPHPQVDPSAVPVGDLDIANRFEFYVQANRAKKTELDLTQLSVEDLKYLVDSKVKLSELAYAQKNTIPYDHFGDAFSSIRYDESRVSGNLAFKWNNPTYTLADIEKEGGICVDQAYYASTLGKGRGIPTIYFIGQGTDGGHAWFGYLARSGKWELDCGRYASQNYPRGYALDPQTWQVVDDTTLANLAKTGDATQPNYQPARNAVAWALLHAGTPVELQALDQARALLPELSEAWQEEGDYLEKNNAPLDQKKAFYNAWIAQFQPFIDMRVEGQKRLLAALKAAHDPDADSIQRDIILQNRSSDFDFGVQGSLGTIEDKFKAQDYDGAKLEFEAAVRDFKDQGGGTFFYNVVRPYMMLCLQYNRPDQADDGIHFVEERMTLDPNSIVSMDFERLKKQLKALKDEILPAMDKWLGEMDDGDYDQAWNDASDSFRLHGDATRWDAFAVKNRQPLGRLVDRKIDFAPRFFNEMSRANGEKVEGVFAYVQFRETFENPPAIKENVVFEREESGDWKAFSYALKDLTPQGGEVAP